MFGKLCDFINSISKSVLHLLAGNEKVLSHLLKWLIVKNFTLVNSLVFNKFVHAKVHVLLLFFLQKPLSLVSLCCVWIRAVFLM